MHPRREPLRGPGPTRRGRRDRRFAVRLHHAGRPEQKDLLRRLRGPSSWRCAPHAHPHPDREAEPL
jgi:hypothetical protein